MIENRWKLQLFVIHVDALLNTFPLPPGWEPIHCERADGNRWHVVARKLMESVHS